MLVPQFHFSQIDQELLSTGTAARLLTACVLGGAIGMERELRHKASGLRTNMLLCLGCAFFTLLSAVLAGDGNPDKGRVAANIVQGIGFLGAGIILHTRVRVQGLTSAATVFVIASIGMACGAGLYIEAVLATVIALVALAIIGYLESIAGWKHYTMLYEVRGEDARRIYVAVLSVLDRMAIRLNVLDKESVAGLERITFAVTTNSKRHIRLQQELRESDANDQVVVFRDVEEE
ncbi:MAG: MgtC/SapB family protein [Edaphobacter sp.]|uniref:MgtC/SapB family protein n=1 Tax=Edaphobacter sp. TaxID=1934404 RepID=UPI0023866D3F|nr:MgtC/SapB family protein [Edaphobacter sp.]MDE1177822.1 MgtC/SapB family protein [Edaphobacter sp.]